MSFATLIGFLAGIGLFIGAIMTATDNYLSFVSLPSIVMVTCPQGLYHILC